MCTDLSALPPSPLNIVELQTTFVFRPPNSPLPPPQVGMIGDLANGRTVRSLCMCLSMYKNVTVYFVAPEVVRMRDDIKVGVG